MFSGQCHHPSHQTWIQPCIKKLPVFLSNNLVPLFNDFFKSSAAKETIQASMEVPLESQCLHPHMRTHTLSLSLSLWITTRPLFFPLTHLLVDTLTRTSNTHSLGRARHLAGAIMQTSEKPEAESIFPLRCARTRTLAASKWGWATRRRVHACRLNATSAPTKPLHETFGFAAHPHPQIPPSRPSPPARSSTPGFIHLKIFRCRLHFHCHHIHWIWVKCAYKV